MDFPGRGKVELIGHMGNLGGYLEGSVPPWGELGCDVVWKLKVLSFEPDLASYFEGFKPRFFLDPGFLHFMLGLLGGFPGFFDVLEAVFYRWNIGFSSGLVNSWSVTDKEVIWGFLCHCRRPEVFGVLSEW